MKKEEYFKNDEYWKSHINDQLEDDMWIDDYRSVIPQSGCALDLGCGIGQYSRKLMEYGYTVVSADISEIAINEVLKFNSNAVQVDMREPLPFGDASFDFVFANLSIHYFSDSETQELISEVKRILKPNGMFVGTVNSLQLLDAMKDIVDEVEPHYYLNRKSGRKIRLFDREDLKKYLSTFTRLEIDERKTIRYGNKKEYLIFLGQV